MRCFSPGDYDELTIIAALAACLLGIVACLIG